MDRVVESWIAGRKYKAGAFSTDGKSIFSYAHEIAYKANAGVRVLFNCHYSHTTVKHVNAVRQYADQIIPCPTHERA